MLGRGPGARREVLGLALILGLLAVVALTTSCSVSIGAAEPAPGPTLLKADEGWKSSGTIGFQPVPFKRPAGLYGDGFSPRLVGATGSRARVKWLADRAEVPGPQDARSTLTVHVVGRSDPLIRADVEFRGAGGAGFADLPITPGERNVYRVSFSATGTYRWCSVMIEARD